MSDAPLRVLHAPADVGGHAFGLSRGERRLGLQSDVAVFAPGPFGYDVDIDLKAGPEQALWRRFARRARFLSWAVRRYDLFHFNFGQTLLTVRQLGRVADEVGMLKRLGKRVFVTYQGCDVRPKAACPCRRPHCFREDSYRGPAAARILRRADRVFFLNPDLRRWLPGARFLPYANVDPELVAAAPPRQADDVRVVHAPTDVDVKGTHDVISAVEELQREGHSVVLDLVQDVSREDVLSRCRDGDIVVDQLRLGWYGGFAVEAMALARPVLAYIREDDPEDNPFGAELPIVRTSAATLASDLRQLVVDREARRHAGELGRRFVEAYHRPTDVARAVLAGLVPEQHL